MSENAKDLALIEKLRIAGATAPTLRGVKRPRMINVVDSTGKTIGQVDHVEIARKLHERIGIEFDVEPGRRGQVRTCKCGRVFILPPKRDWKEHPGRLPKRCEPCRNAPCRVCGGEPTAASKRRGDPATAVCQEHVSTGSTCNKPVPPCSVCGEPAHSPAKARYAVSKGRPVFCAEHKGGPKPAATTCEVCGKTLSVRAARFCSQHRGHGNMKPVPPCTVCGKPARKGSVRRRRSLPYCEDHKGGTGLGQFKKGQPTKRWATPCTSGGEKS